MKKSKMSKSLKVPWDIKSLSLLEKDMKIYCSVKLICSL